MSDVPLELKCPKCGIEVQPIKAVYSWYCPHCAWQFTEEDIEKHRRRKAHNGDGSSPSKPPQKP
jgi:predicted RNA-binding Zn-ribbon protein involved in translation (DUF1610 family)